VAVGQDGLVDAESDTTWQGKVFDIAYRLGLCPMGIHPFVDLDIGNIQIFINDVVFDVEECLHLPLLR